MLPHPVKYLVCAMVMLAGTRLSAGSEADLKLARAELTYVGRADISIEQAVALFPEHLSSQFENGTSLIAKGEVVVNAAGRLTHGRLIAGGGMDWRFTSDQVTLDYPQGSMQWILSGIDVVELEGRLAINGTLAGQAFVTGFELTMEQADVFDSRTTGEHRSVMLPGVDISVSRVGLDSSGCGDDFHYWGTANSIRAFSIASTSCNTGTSVADWVSGSSARHPLIGQNVYRLLDGKFEHIGQSWLKHSFCAVSELTCGSCQSTGCGTLGIGCADTYWATLNDGQDGGAKSDVNPQGFGVSGGIANTHSHPFTIPTADPLNIRGRLQIHDEDILAGGQNFAEIHYVTHDEPLENRHNNASYRAINLTLTGMSGVQGCQSSVEFQTPAIFAWADIEGASVKGVDVPGEGRFHVGYQVTDNENGTWHYELAIHNMNSDRSAKSVSVPVPDCVAVSNIGFHDVDYHSGEIYDGTDWTAVHENDALTWSTQPYDENPNANALRWGTLYNFRFDADAPPQPLTASGTLGLFKPGDPQSVSFNVQAPSDKNCDSCPWDVDDSGGVNATDLSLLLGNWGACPGCPGDFNLDGEINAADLAAMLGNWGACP